MLPGKNRRAQQTTGTTTPPRARVRAQRPPSGNAEHVAVLHALLCLSSPFWTLPVHGVDSTASSAEREFAVLHTSWR
eukprot:15480957-Alexandrium_andersonii.AAC.1